MRPDLSYPPSAILRTSLVCKGKPRATSLLGKGGFTQYLLFIRFCTFFFSMKKDVFSATFL